MQINGDLSNGSVESEASSPTSVASPLQGNTSGGSEAATMTEPDSLGPCEPGTAVKLQGIVWQETDKGGTYVQHLLKRTIRLCFWLHYRLMKRHRLSVFRSINVKRHLERKNLHWNLVGLSHTLRRTQMGTTRVIH